MATANAADPANGTPPLVEGVRRTDFEVPGALVAGTDLAVGTLAVVLRTAARAGVIGWRVTETGAAVLYRLPGASSATGLAQAALRPLADEGSNARRRLGTVRADADRAARLARSSRSPSTRSTSMRSSAGSTWTP